MIGYLILHGFLRGYSLPEGENVIRGRRIFCSNRNKRKGCGRTFSILLANFIRRIIVTTEQLWKFLMNVHTGIKIKNALEMEHCHYSNKSIYRLYQRFHDQQSRIRTMLSQISKPPEVMNSHNPLHQTIEHLKTAFKDHPCPPQAFQYHFQTSIL